MDDPIAFTKGFVYQKNILYIVAVSQLLEEQDIYHAIIFRWLDGQWGHWTVDNRIVSICAFDGLEGRTVMAMGIDGAIQIATPTGKRWERVAEGPESPSHLRHLSAMRVIGRHVYVAGMARQVYRRNLSATTWERADQGALVPSSSLEIAGFNGIDGLSESDIYAVGYYGQIWRYDGTSWRGVDSPTNLRLQCVRCVAPDLVFVCGANGTILAGHGDTWKVIHNEVTDRAFWGMEYFQGTLYLSTDRGAIFKVEGDRIARVDIGLGKPVSTYWLHANDEVLLSVGHSDIMVFDGRLWSTLSLP